jgi:group II intron reverse transcriptase/maturase
VPKKPRSSLEQLSSVRHLLYAWKQISKRNVRSHGLDRVTIEEFRDNLHRNLDEISQQIKSGSYRFTPARGWLAPKPGSAQKRPIKIPAVRDRVVLKAIALLVGARFDRYNLNCSFGYIKNRGVKDAIYRVRKLANEGHGVVLEADIHKFFDEVDHGILFPKFIREIRRPSLTPLIQDALHMEVGNLDAFSDEDKQLFPAADSGIPQGGVLSPMLANFYLYPFDKAMSEAGFNLVRYADDFVVMCKTEKEAQAAYGLAKRVLEQKLHLQLHALGGPSGKTRILRFNKGLKFLGMSFAAGKIAPSETVINKFKQGVHCILHPPGTCSLLNTLTTLRNTIVGWGQCYRDFDIAQLYSDLDSYMRTEVTGYLHRHEFLLQGRNVSRKQIRLLGIPELREFIPRVKSSPKAKPVG